MGELSREKVISHSWKAIRSRIDRRAVVISLLVFVVSSIYPFYIFDHINIRIVACKLIQLLTIYWGVWALDVFLNRLAEDKKLRFGLMLFAVYLGIDLIFLVLIYPGGWRWDDITLFLSVFPSGNWPTWQNYLTAVFYMTCYLTVPMPAFIVCIQVLVISVITAFISYRIWIVTPSPKWLVMGLGVCASLLPPILNMNLYPLRAALHSYLFMLVVFLMVDHFRNRIPWSFSKVLFLAFLSSIVCVWRTECVFLIVLLPIAFFFLNWDKSTRLRIAIAYALSLLCMVFVVGYYQFTHVSDDYVVTAYVPSLPEYAHRAIDEGNEELIEELSKAYDVEVLNQAYVDGVPGSTMFWMKDDEYPFMKQYEDISQDEYAALCREAFMAGTIAYPDLFLENRVRQALDGPLETFTPGYTTNLFEDSRPVFESFRSFHTVSYPFDSDIRTTVASIIEAQGERFGWIAFAYDLRWTIPAYVIAFIVLVLKKRREAIAVPLFCSQALVTLLLAPKYYFMYYYALYLGGVLLAMVGIGFFVIWIKGHRKASRIG